MSYSNIWLNMCCLNSMHHMITSSSEKKHIHPRSILKILKSPKLAAFGHLEAGDLKISEDWHDQMGVGIHFLWPTIGTCLLSISNILVQIGWRPICWLAFLLTTDPHYIQVASLQQQNPGRGLERETGMGQYLLGPSFFKRTSKTLLLLLWKLGSYG